jgi:amino acid adenylation domain-containing protein
MPLSYGQQRLWFLDQFEPGSAAYNIPFGLRLRGPLDYKALRHALNEIVRRHEVLRTTFPRSQGQPIQKIRAAMELDVEEVRLQKENREEREEEVERLVRVEAEKPFDLGKGPLLRVKLLCLGEDEHLLMVTMHHIVSDGWSGGVMVREFSHLYSAYVQGNRSLLPELKIQYADFAVWQRRWLQGEVLERQRAYWKQQLTQVRRLELPADCARPATTGNRSASLIRPLPAGLIHDIKKFALQEGATLFMVLLACWQWLLSRYSGHGDVAIGTVIANRNRVETEALIGFFVNTLVLRARIDSDHTLRDLLKSVRQVTLDAYRHQDLPFEKLVEELDVHRDSSRNPLFDVMFVMQNTPPRTLALAGLKLEEVKIETQATKLDLTLFAEEHGEELDGRLKYNANHFEAATMERMAGHWLVALERMVGDPETRIGEVSLLNGEERGQILVEWNRTEAEYGQACLHELFEERVRRGPEAMAVEFEGQQLTYGELNRRANQLGHYLRKLGVGPEVRVGICMERSLAMVEALLGIVKAGGAYVPLDPVYPAERLRYMLEDAHVFVLVTQSQFAGTLPSGRFRVVVLEASSQLLRAEGAQNLTNLSTADNLAYVIYTSGSTGTPKGVMVSHRAIVNHLQWRQKAYPLAASDRFLHKAALSFDIAAWEIFAPLVAGAQLVVCVPQGHRDSGYLAKTIAQAGITVAHFNPSMLRAFLDEPSVKSCHSLKRVFCGGEVLSAELQNRFLGILPAALHNQYGPTETTVDVLVWDCRREQRVVPIGRPIDNTRVYILDSDLQPVAVGARGELHIGGLPLARGYVNRADLTAERYVPDPFGVEPGARLFKTGDLVRYRQDGSVEFMGRADRQVKVLGFRIELEEIEAVLSGHEGVREVAVVAAEGWDNNQRLVAYVAGLATDEQLRGYVKSKLPDYMAPSVFVRLERLPLTVSGKVDRKALPEPGRSGSGGEICVGPREGEEEVLCGIFSEVLHLEKVDVHTSFFELGGHSLLATQIISRVRNVFEVEVPLRALFEAPTVAGLAERVRAARGDKPPGGPEIRRVAGERVLPLSYAQQRLWFLHQMNPGDAVYNVPVELHLSGDLDRNAIQNSLNEIVRRHEVLRTSFGVREGQPVQEIAAELRLGLEEIDLRRGGEQEREAEVRRMAREEARAPFDLAHGPLLRMKLLQLGDQERVLLVTMHHIVSDGWSMGILVREFRRLYEAEVKGEELALEELQIQYADFAVWQREWLKGEVLEKQLAYWRKQLAGLPVLELPTDFPRPAVMSHGGGNVEVQLGKELTERLKELARQEGVTPFMSLLAGWQVMLGKYAGQQDVAVGTVIANRNRVEVEKLIGFFANTLVLRTNLAGNPSVSQILKRVRRITLDAYQHQDMPFEKLVEELSPQRDLSRSPLFQVMLVVQNTEPAELQLAGVRLREFVEQSDTAKFDLLLTLAERAEGMVGRLSYARDLYEAATMERMVGHWLVVLEKMAAEPEQRIGEISLLSGGEREQVLVEWNRTATENGPGWVHEWFEEQVRRKPEAVAVEFAGKQLTYQELNRRANQLGHYLSKLGVEPEVRVGICMERSLEMVVGLMGILKAGGAYVPLDSGYPAERLSYMLEDARAAVIVVQEKLVDVLSRRGDGPVLVQVDAEWERISRESCDNPGVHLEPTNLAYVIYTSGSTGRPKGAMNTHEGLSNRLQWMQEAYGLGAEERVLQKTPYSFDVSVWEFFWPLMVGARLVVAQPGGHQDPAYLGELIEQEQISTLHFVPSMLRAFLESGRDGREGREGKWGSVRRVICSGEALGRELAKSCLDRIGAELHNLYGPTEAAIDVTCWKCDREEVEKGVAIGRPIANTQVYVLGEEMEPAGIGIAGELYLGGRGLGRGYLGRPELTAERWVPNPFSATEGERLYRTGDWVKWRADGTLVYLRRMDYQVKVRGFRIELAEIEAVLSSHVGVREVVVVAAEGQDGNQRLVAYVAGVATVEQLRGHAKSKLPEYMVPSIFVMLEALPLTASGKVDRQALPSVPGVQASAQYVAPSNSVEERLCAIWEDVLGSKRVGVEDNFFELGGHSLLATQVMSRAQEIFPAKLRMRAIFETPTVSGLGRQIENAMKTEADSCREPRTAPIHVIPIAERKNIQLEQALVELEDLSEEDVQALLETENQNVE